MLPRILCALVISHGLLVAQQAPAASSQVQPVAEPLPLLDTGIPGGIADGTPAVPAPLPEPLQFKVKRTLTSRRQVTEAPEIIGLPAVKGTINVTVQLVEDPGLPDPPPPLITPPVEEAATDGPAELSEPGPDCQFIFVSATVYDHARTYPFHNARGDVIAQFSTGGTMTWHATYAASGLLQDLAGTRVGNYGANGKWEDVNGLINDGFRYRDRLTNTFLTRDPAGFIDGPNDYNYVRHNPWSAWDPNGLATILVPADTGAIGYVATTTPNNAPSVPLSGFDNPPLTVGSSSSMDMPRTGSVSPLDAALFGHSDWFPHPYGIPAWLIDPPNKIPISLSNPYGSSAAGRAGEFGMDLWKHRR